MRPDFEIAPMSVCWNACHPSLLEELSGLSVLKQAPTFFALYAKMRKIVFFKECLLWLDHELQGLIISKLKIKTFRIVKP